MRYLLIFVLALSWCMVSKAQDSSSSIQKGAFWQQKHGESAWGAMSSNCADASTRFRLILHCPRMAK